MLNYKMFLTERQIINKIVFTEVDGSLDGKAVHCNVIINSNVILLK